MDLIKDIRHKETLEYFPLPDQIDPSMQSFLEDACRQLCEWFAKTDNIGPLPDLNCLPDIAPRTSGLSSAELLNDLQILMDGSYQPSHPGALAHLDPPPLIASIVGDLICAGLNNNLLAEELSPSLSKLERNLCKWIATRFGLSDSAGGVAASGGSLTNLMALVLARYKSNLLFDPSAVLFASEDCHVSITRALKVMGLPPGSFIPIETDLDGKLSINSLEREYNSAKSKGKKCFAVVATAGTTVSGAVDPMPEISRFCHSEGLWLHVDAAIGGAYVFSKKTKKLINGLELANSVTFNPQKLLGITKTSSLLLVANYSDLQSCFSEGFPYIEPTLETEAHGGEIGLQGSRSGEVLKLWIGLRQLGEEGIHQLVEESLFRCQYLYKRLDNNKFKIVSGPLHLLAITPKKFDNLQAASWSIATKKELLAKKYMLSRPFYKGRFYLKAVLGNPHTKLHHLDQLSELLNQSL